MHLAVCLAEAFVNDALTEPSTLRCRYECVAAEDVLARGDRYDVVVVSEVIEHVRRPDRFVQTMASLLADAPAQQQEQQHPGGVEHDQGALGTGTWQQAPSVLIVSTLNRTPESFAVAIIGAEYVTGAVPQGTHEWKKFITPMELALMAEQVGQHRLQWKTFIA